MVYFFVTFEVLINGRIAQIKYQIDSWINLIKTIIIVVEHRVILPIWTYNCKIRPGSEKWNSFVIIAEIRLIAPFDRYPSPRRIDSVIVIEILLLVVNVYVGRNTANIFTFVYKIPIDVREKLHLSVIIGYVSQCDVVNILVNILNLILAVVVHYLDLHWWIYYYEY